MYSNDDGLFNVQLSIKEYKTSGTLCNYVIAEYCFEEDENFGDSIQEIGEQDGTWKGCIMCSNTLLFKSYM